MPGYSLNVYAGRNAYPDRKLYPGRQLYPGERYPGKSFWLGALDLNLSGEHSDQGSMIPGIDQKSGSRSKISGHSDRVFAQNFEAVLTGIVICAGDIIFAKFWQEV